MWALGRFFFFFCYKVGRKNGSLCQHHGFYHCYMSSEFVPQRNKCALYFCLRCMQISIRLTLWTSACLHIIVILLKMCTSAFIMLCSVIYIYICAQTDLYSKEVKPTSCIVTARSFHASGTFTPAGENISFVWSETVSGWTTTRGQWYS